MARYIDADKLLNPDNIIVMQDETGSLHFAVKVETILNAPTADVVEVVRCKNCKHKVRTSDGEYNPEDIVCDYHMSDGFDENDYCSYGERRDT